MWHDMNAYGQYVDTVCLERKYRERLSIPTRITSLMFDELTVGYTGNLYGKKMTVPPQAHHIFSIQVKTTICRGCFRKLRKTTLVRSSASIPFDYQHQRKWSKSSD